MNNKNKGIFLAVLAAVLWGVMGVFNRVLTQKGFSSMDIAFVRCFFTGVVFFLFVKKTNPKAVKVDKKAICVSCVYGMVAYSVSFMANSIAIGRTPIAVANVLMFMSPVWASILGIIVFKDKISFSTVATICVCFMGAILTSNLINSSGGKLDAFGLIAGVINGVGVALQIVIPRYYSDRYEQDTMLVYGFLGGALLLALFADLPMIFMSLLQLDTLIPMLLVSLVCTMVANISFVRSSAMIGTTMTSILTSLQTVVGAAVGYLCFQETMNGLQVLGAVIIVLGTLGPNLYRIFFAKAAKTNVKCN